MLAETLLLWKIANISEAPGTKHDDLVTKGKSPWCVQSVLRGKDKFFVRNGLLENVEIKIIT